MSLTGRRRPDTIHGELPDEIEVGDYWKVLDRGTGKPIEVVDCESNLTGGCWEVACPNPSSYSGKGYLLAHLRLHTVREHEDGTISVRPGDGSSNSILVEKGSGGPTWHGYIEHGTFDPS